MVKPLLFAALAAFTIFYLSVFLVGFSRARRGGAALPSLPSIATGFGTNFLDTLGIGSFATSTAIFKFWKMVPDELIPGTLNAGHTLPVIFQAFIFTLLSAVFIGQRYHPAH